jgi:hypothetical protein
LPLEDWPTLTRGCLRQLRGDSGEGFKVLDGCGTIGGHLIAGIWIEFVPLVGGYFFC